MPRPSPAYSAVRLTGHYKLSNSGEIAGYPAAEARLIVERGLGVYVDQPEEEPVDDGAPTPVLSPPAEDPTAPGSDPDDGTQSAGAPTTGAAAPGADAGDPDGLILPPNPNNAGTGKKAGKS